MDILGMSIQRKLILAAAAIGIISIFLPWITVSIMGMDNSQNGFRGAGIVVFLAFAGAAIVSMMGEQKSNLERTMWMAALAAGVVAFLFTIISFGSSADGDAMGFVEAGHGIGIWLALIASIGVAGAAWLYKNPSDNIKEGIEGLKSGSFSFASAPKTDTVAELEKLIELKNQGKISEEEYRDLKSKIIK